jgi:hypothetical protein
MTATLAIRPINKSLLVRKCFTDHIRNEDGTIRLWLPDENVDFSRVCEILAISSDCKVFHQDDVGKFVVGPEIHNDMQGVGDGRFLIRERCFLDSTGGKPYLMSPR